MAVCYGERGLATEMFSYNLILSTFFPIPIFFIYFREACRHLLELVGWDEIIYVKHLLVCSC